MPIDGALFNSVVVTLIYPSLHGRTDPVTRGENDGPKAVVERKVTRPSSAKRCILGDAHHSPSLRSGIHLCTVPQPF